MILRQTTLSKHMATRTLFLHPYNVLEVGRFRSA